MTLSITLAGEPAEAVAFDGKVLRAISLRALAPGQPAELLATLPGLPLRLSVKSRGSRRRSDGRFEVRLALRSARREELDALTAALS